MCLRQVRQVQRHHQHVGDALGAFGLEVVFGHPERAVAQAIERLGGDFRLVQGGGQLFVRVAAVVDRGAGVADVFQIDMAGVGAVELPDHGFPLPGFSAVSLIPIGEPSKPGRWLNP